MTLSMCVLGVTLGGVNGQCKRKLGLRTGGEIGSLQTERSNLGLLLDPLSSERGSRGSKNEGSLPTVMQETLELGSESLGGLLLGGWRRLGGETPSAGQKVTSCLVGHQQTVPSMCSPVAPAVFWVQTLSLCLAAVGPCVGRCLAEPQFPL